jgi:cobalt-zinc-cadmium efflux system protein
LSQDHHHHDHEPGGRHRGEGRALGSHNNAHVHAPANFGLAFAIGVALNLGFVLIEIVYGLLANSIALVADAGHNLGDVLGLALAWIAMVLGRRAPSEILTYGFGRGTILAAVANAVLLLLTVGAIAVEGVRRLFEPAPVAGATIMAVAAAGIVVNGLTAWLFMSGRKGDINLRGAFLHMASDAFVSLGVVIAGAAILLTGWTWLDPLMSVAIALVILWGTWGLLRDSMAMALDAVPSTINSVEVRAFLEGQTGVLSVHDLHIWPMSTTETALTCHCVLPGGHPGDEFLVRVAGELRSRFGIGHATIQVEVDANVPCALEADRVV